MPNAAKTLTPNRGLKNFVLPRLKTQLETLQKQTQQARGEQAEAEQQLRDEQAKLDELNALLDRYNTALEEVGQR